MTKSATSPSGMEIMTGMLAGHSPAPAIAATLNFRLTEVGEGSATFTGAPQEPHTNPMGTVHGGWYGAILDSCMACAVSTLVPAGSTYTTLEYKVNIIRPIPVGTEVAAVGTTQHVGRSTGIAMGEIRGVADGRVYATGSTTCIVMPVRG